MLRAAHVASIAKPIFYSPLFTQRPHSKGWSCKGHEPSHAPAHDPVNTHPSPPPLADGGSTASLHTGKAVEAKGGGIA